MASFLIHLKVHGSSLCEYNHLVYYLLQYTLLFTLSAIYPASLSPLHPICLSSLSQYTQFIPPLSDD